MSLAYGLEAGTGTRAWEVGRQERVDLPQSKWGSHSKCLLLFILSVAADSLHLHGLQHTRLPCPSPSPGACSNSRTLSRCGYLTSLLPCLQSSLRLIQPSISYDTLYRGDDICRPLLLLPSIFPSIRVFSNESFHIRWPNYWSFSFSISSSNEYSGLISFRIDSLDLPAVEGTFRRLLQCHSSKASILGCSAFFKGPTLSSIHYYWKNHSFDSMDLSWQSNVSAF